MTNELKSTFIQLLDAYESGGDLEGLIKTALRVKKSNVLSTAIIEKKLDDYKHEQVKKAIRDSSRPFHAYRVAKQHGVATDSIVKDVPSLDADFKNLFLNSFLIKVLLNQFC